MSYWIHAYCHSSVASVTPEELAAGIAERLTLLTYLFCPPEEEEPEDVLDRLRIENKSTDGTFRVYELHYRPNSPTFIRVERADDPGIVGSGLQESEETLAGQNEPAVAHVRQLLAGAREQVSFCLKAHDFQSMGLPLTIAAAAYLVKKAGGIIQSGGCSWMVPAGKEVNILFEFDPRR